MEERRIHFTRYETMPHLVPEIQPQHSKLSEWLHKCWTSLLQFFTQEKEPRVWQTSDHTGQIWWHAHDPISGRSLVCTTTEEVQIWLDQL